MSFFYILLKQRGIHRLKQYFQCPAICTSRLSRQNHFAFHFSIVLGFLIQVLSSRHFILSTYGMWPAHNMLVSLEKSIHHRELNAIIKFISALYQHNILFERRPYCFLSSPASITRENQNSFKIDSFISVSLIKLSQVSHNSASIVKFSFFLSNFSFSQGCQAFSCFNKEDLFFKARHANILMTSHVRTSFNFMF